MFADLAGRVTARLRRLRPLLTWEACAGFATTAFALDALTGANASHVAAHVSNRPRFLVLASAREVWRHVPPPLSSWLPSNATLRRSRYLDSVPNAGGR